MSTQSYISELSDSERTRLRESCTIVTEAIVHNERVGEAVMNLLDLLAHEVELDLHVTKTHFPVDQAARMDECTRSQWTGIDKAREQLCDGVCLADLSEQLEAKED